MPNGSLQTDGVVLADSVSSPLDEIAAAQQSIQNSLDSGRPRYPYQTLLTENMIDFDDDEPGRNGIKEVAPLFTPGKLKIMKYSGIMNRYTCRYNLIRQASHIINRHTLTFKSFV